MSFQFCCPQGHVLCGEPSQVGQLVQCPMCGSSFLIPPPEMGSAAAGGFFQGPGSWQATAPGSPYAAQGAMPGMMPPQSMPTMPGGPMPPGPYPMQPPQPFALGPPAAPEAPVESPQQPPATVPQSETGKPRFDLGFDPSAKEALPFDLPGYNESEAESAPAAPLPAPSFPAASFPSGTLPAASFPAPLMPAPAFEPSVDGPDFLQSTPAATEEAATPQEPPKVLHIRCPSGHLVQATSDLLGKKGRCPACKKTFELRYEDSVEFQRRKEKVLRREEIKTEKAWMAWAFLAAFLVFAGLVALMLALSR